LKYQRIKIETGECWKTNAERFDASTRADATLMSNLKAIRKSLLSEIQCRSTEKELDKKSLSNIVHALLGRSILIKYLEERTDSMGNTVFPVGFFGQFKTGATRYTNILADKDAVYELFCQLDRKFNGDMFPLVEREYEIITQDDLDELQFFILGESELASQQMVL
jgi:hypothetical protein